MVGGLKGSAKLTILPLELGQASRRVGRGAGSIAGVDFGLKDPVAQGLGVDAELAADALEGVDPGRRVAARVQRHADRSPTQLVGVLLRRRRGDHPPLGGVACRSPSKPGLDTPPWASQRDQSPAEPTRTPRVPTTAGPPARSHVTRHAQNAAVPTAPALLSTACADRDAGALPEDTTSPSPSSVTAA